MEHTFEMNLGYWKCISDYFEEVLCILYSLLSRPTNAQHIYIY